MLKKSLAISVCAFLLLCLPAFSYSQEPSGDEDFLNMSLYELMNVKVTTAGRLSPKISEAPAAMSVVTAEDIRLSGARSLSEALAMVPGVHLGKTSSVFQAAGGIRGFHKLTVKAHFKETDWSDGSSLGEDVLNFQMGTRGLEIVHKWHPFASDTLVWGANFNQKYAEGPSIGGKKTHDLPGVFLDNTYDVTDQISLNAGVRCDRHPNTDYTVSHRLSLVLSPYRKRNFRLTWGTSYRNPDFVENYYSRISPYGEGSYLHVFGQEDNDPEKAETYELAYYGQVSEKCVISVNLFYSYLDDFIYFIQQEDPYFDPSRNGIVVPYPFTNIGDAEQYGAEVEFNYQITRWLNGIINYTCSDQKAKDPRTRSLVVMTPQNMVNGQLRAIFDNGISANVSAHYKDVTEWRQYPWPSPEGNTISRRSGRQSYLRQFESGICV